MIFIYFVVLAIIIFGGILAYAFGVAISALIPAMTATLPTHYTGLDLVFITQWWFYMPVFIVLGVLIYVIVNGQREAYGR